MDVVIDTDPGIDDALALMLALRSPELDVRGITVVHGNIDVEAGARNALKILQLMDRTDVPVSVGASAPLLRPLRTAPFIHGHDGLGDLLPAPEGLGPVEQFGPAFLARAVEQSTEPVTVIALGPLTNIAIALLSAPHIASRLERLVIMGGGVRTEGNTIPGAEFNLHCDPEAGAIVFRSGVPITMVGLNVTMRAILPASFSQKLGRSADPLERFVGEVTSFYAGHYRSYYGIDGCAMHDPLTVAAVIDPGVIRGEELFVDVETRGEITAGQTVADFWETPEPRGRPNALVAVDLDSERFLSLYCDRVFGRYPV